MNGLSTNQVRLNGIDLSGVRANGIKLNRVEPAGRELYVVGERAGGEGSTVLTIELPHSNVAR